MEEALKKGGTTNGFDAALSPLIVASGENSSYPHAELTERKVRRKDVVLCDISLRYMGYNSDATRTFLSEMWTPISLNSITWLRIPRKQG